MPDADPSMVDAPQAQEVLRRAQAIPEGFVSTYGDLCPDAPRFAGAVMANCHDPRVPWQRVVRADGSLAKGQRQRRLLEREGVPFRGDRVDLELAQVAPEALDDDRASRPAQSGEEQDDEDKGAALMRAKTSIVTGVDFVAVPTKDYEKAAEFYGTVLGLPFGKRWGKMPAGEFETGNLTIAVMQSDAFGLEFVPHTHPIALHVDDFEGAKSELESHGVEFKGETIDSGVCWQAFFEDPDGNSLGIHHRYAPPGPGASDSS